MKIKKLVPNCILPEKAHDGDAGFDVYAPNNFTIWPHETLQVKLNFAIEINSNEVCIMSERSGHAIKYGITTIGNIIDSCYRGECSIIMQNNGNSEVEFKHGDRIGQMLIIKLGSQELEEVDELSETIRGENAYGSSGK